MAANKASNEARPPADAPIPTMGKAVVRAPAIVLDMSLESDARTLWGGARRSARGDRRLDRGAAVFFGRRVVPRLRC